MDLERAGDLELTRAGAPYRSALVVGLRNAKLIGAVSVDLDGADQIPWEWLRAMLESGERAVAEPEALPAAPPDVSVVVTTCSDLGVVDSVASILLCDPPPSEVIVVENRPGRSPVQRALALRFGSDNRLRYVEEARPGLGAARNAGLRVATAGVVAFTDDDVEVDQRWVGSISRAFAAQPDAGCVTGLILPRDLLTSEQAMFEQFAGFGKGFGRRVHRLSEPTSRLFPFAAGEYGSGASTALRASVARSIDGFDGTLGSGTPARGAEDLDIYIRVLLAGYALVYEPAAIVWHRHPSKAGELRRKVFSYGVGLSALLTKYAVSGYALPILRRAPAGLHHLNNSGSRKNVYKGPDYSRSLNWIERAGMVTGPVAYGISRRRERRTGYAGTGAPPRRCQAVWVGEFDPGVPSRGLEPGPQPAGIPYEHARLLARIGGRPVGFVDVPLCAGTASGALVDAEAARQLCLTAPDRSVHATSTSGPDTNATVVVCTRDRPESLRTTLASILAMAGSDQLEAIVVDNAPATSETQALVHELADARLRYVLEPVPGLSRARNRGVAEAGSEVIAFTDDDVTVDAGWLRAITRGFARSARVSCVTGFVAPAALDTPAQAYFDAAVKWSTSLTPRLFDLGAHSAPDPLFPYRAGEFGAGANFAVTRETVVRLGGFDEALGAGSPAHGGEDLDFFARVILGGGTIAYEPAALVWHAHRTDLDALRSQILGYRTGLAAYAFKHLFSSRAHRVLFGAARDLWTHIGSASVPGPLTPQLPGVLRAELIGLTNGPGAYLRGRSQIRRRAPIAF